MQARGEDRARKREYRYWTALANELRLIKPQLGGVYRGRRENIESALGTIPATNRWLKRFN